jgi:peroxiredoxin
MKNMTLLIFPAILLLAFPISIATAQEKPPLSGAEKAILEEIRGLRKVSDTDRGSITSELALKIRQLPASQGKLSLANSLANLSTEGDYGFETLQQVGTTLAIALRENPSAKLQPYLTLAQLVRYEKVQASLDSRLFSDAMSQLVAADKVRANAHFTLADLEGKSWSLEKLQGKVVMLNFWATWCPPCRKEMSDLQRLYERYRDQGFVLLAISDDNPDKVRAYIAENKYTFPALLDPERKVSNLFQVEGIPKSFVFDRQGKLVSQAIDMRTEKQFLAMLSQAGLK